MSRIYVVGRPQKSPSCRINSVLVGCYLRGIPTLLDTLQPLPSVNNFLLICEKISQQLLIDGLEKQTAENTQLQENYSFKKSFDEKDIEVINKLYGGLFDSDPFGLKKAYDDMQWELTLNPRTEGVVQLVQESENIFAKNPGRYNDGLQYHEIGKSLRETNLGLSLAGSKEIFVQKPQEAYQSEAAEKIDKLFTDDAQDQLIQITAGGHSTVFGKTAEGKYWQFDGLKGVIQEGKQYAASVIIVYENKAEALQAMKERAKKGASEYSTIVRLPDKDQISERIKEYKKTRQQPKLGSETLDDLEARYKYEVDYYSQLKRELEQIQIPQGMDEAKSRRAELVKNLTKEQAQASQALGIIDLLKNLNIESDLEIISAQMEFIKVALKELGADQKDIRELLGKKCADAYLNKVFLPLAADTLKKVEQLGDYDESKMGRFIELYNELGKVLAFLKREEFSSLKSHEHIQVPVLENMEKKRAELFNKLPKYIQQQFEAEGGSPQLNV